ncbi:MAG: CoA transferase [Hyphomicrobiaceae bacterium]
MHGILDGMRIVEGSAFVAAPLGGMTLAALGADVIRFDDIGGGLDAERWPVTEDGVSLYWAGLNKGKRSFAVDLHHPKGRELIGALITAPGQDAGIFSTNLPAKGWLAYDALAANRQDLVMLAISGAHDGSAQVDYTVNALTGFPMMTGPVDHSGPVNQVLPAWDIATGYAAATAILAAERFRARTGRGQQVRLALQDIALSAVAALGMLSEGEINAVDRPRLGNEVYGTFARDFETKDGRHVMICVFTARQLSALVEAGEFDDAFAEIERTHGVDLRHERHRWELRQELADVVAPWIASLTLAEASEKLSRAKVLWAPYRMPRELTSGDPLLTDNPMFQRVNQPDIGEIWSAASPYNFGALARLPARPAPQLGEHTDEILADILQLSSGAIGRLHDKGIVRGPVAA